MRVAALARNNASVRAGFRVRSSVGVLAIVLLAAAGCTAPAQEFVDKVRADATEKCDQGNQIACHTIVQRVTDTKVVVETTLPLEAETTGCNAGKQPDCQQVAVLHSELSGWCAMGNNQACTTVNVGPWPTKWDEPALLDAAKLSCLSGQFKPESHTCQALDLM